jgi:outer membrane immunogenic protein
VDGPARRQKLRLPGDHGHGSGLTAIPVGVPGTTTILDERLQWFGTFRGRLGFTVLPSTLLYATGGLAYGSLKSDLAIFSFTPAGLPISAAASSNTTHAGWTIGGGIETMFGPNWSGKLEYLYMDLGSITATGNITTAAGAGVGVNLNTRVTDNIFRVGVNYRFSAGLDSVVARY